MSFLSRARTPASALARRLGQPRVFSRQLMGTNFASSVRRQQNFTSAFPSLSIQSARCFSFTSRNEGTPETLEYRIWFNKDGNEKDVISPWHDIPMKSGDLFNYVNEIPLGSRAKMEIATDEHRTPIKQDTKKGALRFFKYGDIPFNYGCIPQTYEDPEAVHPDTGYPGDNDPVDVVEVSNVPITMGGVVPCKVIGILALIDEEETDWKVIAIAETNPLFEKINSEADLKEHLPGYIENVVDWFTNYKVPDGKPVNSFAFDGQMKDAAYAREILEETHESWKVLRTSTSTKLSLE